MLIIKCEMLKVKHLTRFKPKKWRQFWPRLQEKSSSAQFILQPSVAFKLDVNQNLVLYRMQVVLER